MRLPRLSAVVLALASLPAAAQSFTSAIVRPGADGRLEYVSDADGNRVPDFSSAGYRGGGVPIPAVPTVATVQPADGDDTALIQAAIDGVSARPLGADGVRGAVLLAPGEYQISGTIKIRESGVVLRGSGNGADPATATILRRSGANQTPIVYVGRSESASGDAIIRRNSGRAPTAVTDPVVPIGARSVNVDFPERYRAGDPVVLFHPATLAWINAVDGGGTATDPRWAVNDKQIGYARTVVSVVGTLVTLDAPSFYRMDTAVSPVSIYLRSETGIIREVGVEALRIDIETVSPRDETQAEDAVIFALVENAWADRVTALHFWHAGLSVQNSRYVTVQNSEALEPNSVVDGERRYNFEVARSQLVLFQGNRASDARHAYVGNGETLDSGIVFLDNTAENGITSSEAHRGFGQGFLYDNHTEIGSRGTSTGDRRIHLGNRGDYGTSHGWACANCVVWNAQMNGALVVVEKPPTAQNYAIGVQGTVSNRGPFLVNTTPYVEGTNAAGLDPRSLYLRQLADRLAPVANEDTETGQLRLLPPAPNPAAGVARLRFELPAAADVRLAVYDVLGREVAVAADGRFAAGPQAASVDTSRLAPGLYIIRLTTPGAVRATRLTVLR